MQVKINKVNRQGQSATITLSEDNKAFMITERKLHITTVIRSSAQNSSPNSAQDTCDQYQIHENIICHHKKRL